MSLTKAERTIVVSMWGKIATQADVIGMEALERLFSSFPQTKTYFPHFDLHPGSAQLRAHGGGGGSGRKAPGARALSLPPFPPQLLSHCLLVTVASHFPADFTADAHAAWDKFLSTVSRVLTEKYR
ncbi:hemoglobin subunit zeta [Camelus ferus]|nr:hemoglobin subunit zeta [Camelus ferus]